MNCDEKDLIKQTTDKVYKKLKLYKVMCSVN